MRIALDIGEVARYLQGVGRKRERRASLGDKPSSRPITLAALQKALPTVGQGARPKTTKKTQTPAKTKPVVPAPEPDPNTEEGRKLIAARRDDDEAAHAGRPSSLNRQAYDLFTPLTNLGPCGRRNDLHMLWCHHRVSLGDSILRCYLYLSFYSCLRFLSCSIFSVFEPGRKGVFRRGGCGWKKDLHPQNPRGELPRPFFDLCHRCAS